MTLPHIFRMNWWLHGFTAGRKIRCPAVGGSCQSPRAAMSRSSWWMPTRRERKHGEGSCGEHWSGWFYHDLWAFMVIYDDFMMISLGAHQGSTLWGRPCRWCRREWEPEICHRRLARGWQRGSRLARKSWIHLLQRNVTTEALRIPDTCSAQKSFYSFLWKNHEGSKSDIGLKKAYLRVVAWRCCPWRYPKLLFGDQFRRDPVASLPLGLGTEAAQLGALRGQVRQPLAEEEPGHGDVVQVWRAQFRWTVWDGRVTKGRS